LRTSPLCNLLATVLILVATSCANADQGTATSTSTPTSLVLASPASTKQMRQWWDDTTFSLMTTIDSIDGIAQGLSDHPDNDTNDTYITPEKITDWHNDDPPGWDDVTAALGSVVATANDAIDQIDNGKQGDQDAISRAASDDHQIRDGMCHALNVARVHYAAAGGDPADLRYDYNADWGDPSCTLIDGRRTSATLVRATIGFQASEIGEEYDANGDPPADQMFIDGHATHLLPGTRVTVIERRNALDSNRENGAGRECRVQVTDRQWWIPCKVLSNT
jgi:hypothetical protein